MSEPEPKPSRTLDEAARTTDPDRSALDLTASAGDTASPKAAKSATPMPATVGRFQIRAVLGTGAFGRVYRAFDPDLHREVAVKVPLPGVLSTGQRRDRFHLEARAAAGLQHPNICPVYEVGRAAEQPFIVMAYVPGHTLEAVLRYRTEPLSVRQAVGVLRRIALGVEAAHAKGVIHRDLKPANIIIDRERKEPVITDFGLARLAQEGFGQVTQDGKVLGTPSYMAPEQALGAQDQIDRRTDVYSLGVILFELLTGDVPFYGHLTQVLGMHIAAERPIPSEFREGLDPRLDAICTRAMAKNPDDRYPTAKALADALDAFARQAPATGTQSVMTSEIAVPAPTTDIDINVELVETPVSLRSPTKAVRWRALVTCCVVAVLSVAVGIGAYRWAPRPSFRAVSPEREGPIPATDAQQPVAGPAGGENAKSAGEKVEAFEYVFEGVRKKGTRSVLALDLGGGESLELVRIPKGSFLFGASDRPQQRLEIRKDFYLGKCEVTQAQYRTVVGDSPSQFKGDRRPVERVSWDDAVAFCAAVSKKIGRRVELPGEAHWEYGCRAGTTTPFHFGSSNNGELANCNGQSPFGIEPKGPRRGDTADVGSYPANQWGLHDMHGNVWEWCQPHLVQYGSTTVIRDPLQIARLFAEGRAFLGGCYANPPSTGVAGYSTGNSTKYRANDVGFRVCLIPDE